MIIISYLYTLQSALSPGGVSPARSGVQPRAGRPPPAAARAAAGRRRVYYPLAAGKRAGALPAPRCGLRITTH